MSNPNIDFIEFPDSGSLTANRTYVIRKNHTRIIAPAEQIFDANLAVGGTWDIERAYPQWFGAKAYTNLPIIKTNK
jgi:hypothetical protein